MVTATATATDRIAKHLNNVIELDFDAIGAYKAAIERLENEKYRSKLEEFLKDHENHIKTLTKLVKAQGERPSTSGDFKEILTKGRVMIAGLANDHAILRAMKLNEEQTNKKYEVESAEDYPEEIHDALTKGLEDERKHKDWIDKTLKSVSR